MKREEAIKIIEGYRPRIGYIILNKALDMAITALQNQSVWIPCIGCKDCKNKECEHYGKV